MIDAINRHSRWIALLPDRRGKSNHDMVLGDDPDRKLFISLPMGIKEDIKGHVVNKQPNNEN